MRSNEKKARGSRTARLFFPLDDKPDDFASTHGLNGSKVIRLIFFCSMICEDEKGERKIEIIKR